MGEAVLSKTKTSGSLLAEVKRRLLRKGWSEDPVAYGIHTLTNGSIAGATQTIAIWSMSDPGKTPATRDVVQVEISVRLNDLEDFIADRLGPGYANEMGKTVSVFLHRLIPDGKTYGQGFPLDGAVSPSNASCDRLVDFIEHYGLPFASKAMSGALFAHMPDGFEMLVDPLKWEVRRILVELANDSSLSPESALEGADDRLTKELKKKFTRMASVNRNVDVEREIDTRTLAYRQFVQLLLDDPQFLASARSRILERRSP